MNRRPPGEQLLEEFAAHLNYPLVIVGPDLPNHFMLNQAAQGWLDELQLPEASWQAVEMTEFSCGSRVGQASVGEKEDIEVVISVTGTRTAES